MFRSIRTRIIAATAGCLAVALLLNTIINYQVTRRDNLQAQHEMLVSTRTSHGMAISDWVSSKMAVIASLDNVALSDDPVPQFLQMARAGGFSNVYVGYASKTAKFSDPTGVPADYDPTLRPWYQQVAHDDAPVVTAPYVDAGTGKLVVTFAVPVKDNGTLKAVVAGDVTMDNVIANVREIHPTPASSGLLLNNDGSVIAASDPALTLKPFSQAISGVSLSALARGDTVQGALGGSNKIFSAIPVQGTHWLLVVALDHQDATSGMNALLKASLIAFIVLMLVGGGVVHLLVAAMLKRLLTIRDAMLSIGNGTNDLSQRLPENGKDEVSQIAHAFNLFSDKLAQVMLQLRDATSSVQTAQGKLPPVTATFLCVPSRRPPACVKPPAPWSKSPPPFRNPLNPPPPPARRQKKPPKWRRKAAAWCPAPSTPCRPSNPHRRKLVISPASLTVLPSRPTFWLSTLPSKRPAPGNRVEVSPWSQVKCVILPAAAPRRQKRLKP